MAWLRRSFTLLIVAGLVAGIYFPAIAQQQTSREFPETKHFVIGEFLAYYQSVPDPLLVFGGPITDEFADPTSYLKMQYFQKARFELHEDAPAGQRVKLSLVGSLVYQKARVQPVLMPTNTPACRAFSSTDGRFNVCYAFLAFFDTHGGLALFGSPISDYVIEGDLYVQYFERARFEWHPEMSPDHWVKLADIGRIQFDQSGRNRKLLEPNQAEFIGSVEIVKLQAHAFVSTAVVKTNSTQTLYVVVQDQSYQPISGALALAKIKLPSGDEQRFILPPSDENGISQVQLPVGQQSANQIVQIKVEVTYSSFIASTSAWYRIWW
jgi:hypothetical protein